MYNMCIYIYIYIYREREIIPTIILIMLIMLIMLHAAAVEEAPPHEWATLIWGFDYKFAKYSFKQTLAFQSHIDSNPRGKICVCNIQGISSEAIVGEIAINSPCELIIGLAGYIYIYIYIHIFD